MEGFIILLLIFFCLLFAGRYVLEWANINGTRVHGGNGFGFISDAPRPVPIPASEQPVPPMRTSRVTFEGLEEHIDAQKGLEIFKVEPSTIMLRGTPRHDISVGQHLVMSVDDHEVVLVAMTEARAGEEAAIEMQVIEYRQPMPSINNVQLLLGTALRNPGPLFEWAAKMKDEDENEFNHVYNGELKEKDK